MKRSRKHPPAFTRFLLVILSDISERIGILQNWGIKHEIQQSVKRPVFIYRVAVSQIKNTLSEFKQHFVSDKRVWVLFLIDWLLWTSLQTPCRINTRLPFETRRYFSVWMCKLQPFVSCASQQRQSTVEVLTCAALMPCRAFIVHAID